MDHGPVELDSEYAEVVDFVVVRDVEVVESVVIAMDVVQT